MSTPQGEKKQGEKNLGEKKQGENPGPFNLDELKELFEMMEKYNLSDVSLQHENYRYRLRRGPEATMGMPMANYQAPSASVMPQQQFSPPPPGNNAPPVNTGSTNTATDADAGLIPIKSPTVGTFYTAPSPGEAAFVKVGDAVKADTTVCLIEAMKVFNPIQAEVTGTIAKLLVSDGDTVEFGQPLFLVNP